ncbi:MAG: hypothetical protein WA989_09310 [Henriciella sp.]|uniref:response regulator n=1 Tax=Henriciella sp. TaxID=1968823 RepID=UPI003C775284
MPQRPNILIVEDELMVGLHLKVEVESFGYAVTGPVSSVEGAMAALDQENIDAAVLDLQLYDELSLSIAQALWQRGVPFVFVTGLGVGTLPETYDKVRILRKPVDFRQLKRTLAEICKVQTEAGETKSA